MKEKGARIISPLFLPLVYTIWCRIVTLAPVEPTLHLYTVIIQ